MPASSIIDPARAGALLALAPAISCKILLPPSPPDTPQTPQAFVLSGGESAARSVPWSLVWRDGRKGMTRASVGVVSGMFIDDAATAHQAMASKTFAAGGTDVTRIDTSPRPTWIELGRSAYIFGQPNASFAGTASRECALSSQDAHGADSCEGRAERLRQLQLELYPSSLDEAQNPHTLSAAAREPAAVFAFVLEHAPAPTPPPPAAPLHHAPVIQQNLLRPESRPPASSLRAYYIGASEHRADDSSQSCRLRAVLRPAYSQSTASTSHNKAAPTSLVGSR